MFQIGWTHGDRLVREGQAPRNKIYVQFVTSGRLLVLMYIDFVSGCLVCVFFFFSSFSFLISVGSCFSCSSCLVWILLSLKSESSNLQAKGSYQIQGPKQKR